MIRRQQSVPFIIRHQKQTRPHGRKQLCSHTKIESIYHLLACLDWIGLDWIGLDWIGLDWIVASAAWQSTMIEDARYEPTK